MKSHGRVYLVVAAVAGVASAAGCSAAPGADQQQMQAPSTTGGHALAQASGTGTVTFPYKGAVVQTYHPPAGGATVTIVASGGAGGLAKSISDRSAGAKVTGTVTVADGQELLISVAQQGGDATTHDTNAQGGWGGLGATGGNGDSASDYLRSSAAGGGATTVQLADANGQNAQTILVAGGGGGTGGGSGDPAMVGRGGDAGCIAQSASPFWSGSSGTRGSTKIVKGGVGGAAAAETGPGGAPGLGGHETGGNGGGGGGGANGGAPGGGASMSSAGGGGGAGGSATYSMTSTSVICLLDGGGNGQVQVTPQTT